MDGLPDIVEVDAATSVKLWRNVGGGTAEAPAAMGDWLGLRLSQPAPNRDAIGAWVEVKVGDRTVRREVTVGGGHASGQLGWIHFGLGRRTTRRSGSVAGRRGRARGCRSRRTGYVAIERGAQPRPAPVVVAGG